MAVHRRRSLLLVIHLSIASAFSSHNVVASCWFRNTVKNWATSPANNNEPSFENSSVTQESKQVRQNAAYIEGLLQNLQGALDRWIVSGSPEQATRAQNILDQIQRQALNEQQAQLALRMVQRAGLKLTTSTTHDKKNTSTGTHDSTSHKKELGRTDAEQRRNMAAARTQWETEWEQQRQDASILKGRSALSSRKPDLFMETIGSNLQSFDHDKRELQQTVDKNSGGATTNEVIDTILNQERAAIRSAELVALAGAGFDGEQMGIGGLDDVLAEIKRRVWVPLAAPPRLLYELGISPVRGLLLYGRPGCGKTLLASTVGRILSPSRPVTVVSGPELMDKFVGSSEKNLREVFDNPPDIYNPNDDEAMAKAALHVIIMDEFDAMARSRGGARGDGSQGDAGVARDSVVNQLLAKMDGVDPLVVPTLVIGLTNKRSLIDAALLRPGRFEVQIEVPPPRTKQQRVSILRVHTLKMYQAGRLLVNDAPVGTAAANHADETFLSYAELLELLADECEGMSGASLAGVARAAASHALERAVIDFSSTGHSMLDCLVTQQDFEHAVVDVFERNADADWEEEDDVEEEGAQGNDIKDGDVTDGDTQDDGNQDSQADDSDQEDINQS